MILDHIQIFSIVVGLFLMFLFGCNWSSDILHRATSNTVQGRFILYINLIGFLIGLFLCFPPNLWPNLNHKKEPIKKQPVYILFLDGLVIRDEHSRRNVKALAILNTFLEKTNAKIVITSKDRINFATQTNWPIETLRAFYKIWGIKGTVIGATPYIGHNSTRQQEINLWHNITKIKYDGCIILDKTDHSVNNIKCTIKVKNLLNNRHILNILNKLEMDQDPDMFKERLQTYDEQFEARFGQIS